MESFRKYLQRFPHYTSNSFEIALPFLSEITLKAGEYFLREGKVSKEIAFITQGLLRLYYLNEGNKVTTCFCKENTITTSYKSLIIQKESEMAIQAIEETTLVTLSQNALKKLYEKDLFWQQLGRLAAENEFVVSESHSRYISDLSATERYLQILEKDPELMNRVPLTFLASYLQIAPETLSRIRKKLIRT